VIPFFTHTLYFRKFLLYSSSSLELGLDYRSSTHAHAHVYTPEMEMSVARLHNFLFVTKRPPYLHEFCRNLIFFSSLAGIAHASNMQLPTHVEKLAHERCNADALPLKPFEDILLTLTVHLSIQADRHIHKSPNRWTARALRSKIAISVHFCVKQFAS
jgi:hypothetical protein